MDIYVHMFMLQLVSIGEIHQYVTPPLRVIWIMNFTKLGINKSRLDSLLKSLGQLITEYVDIMLPRNISTDTFPFRNMLWSWVSLKINWEGSGTQTYHIRKNIIILSLFPPLASIHGALTWFWLKNSLQFHQRGILLQTGFYYPHQFLPTKPQHIHNYNLILPCCDKQ